MEKISRRLKGIFKLDLKSQICSILILANIQKSIVNAYLPNYVSKEEVLNETSRYSNYREDDKASHKRGKIFRGNNPLVEDTGSGSANSAWGGFDLFYKSVYLRLFVMVSTISHCLFVFHGIAIISINNGLFGLDKQSSCYLLGRLQAYTQAAEALPYIQIVIGIYELKWRFNTTKLNQCYLDCLPFLLRDENNLTRQLRHDLGEDGPGRQRRWKLEKRGLMYNEAGHQFASSKRPIDNYLKDLLYLRLDLNENTIQMNLLRPNRTLESRKMLIESLNRILRVIYWLSAIIFTISAPIIAENIIIDRSHIAYYPGCYKELEKLLNEGKLVHWSTSFHKDGYRFCAILADAWMNTFVWADSGFGTFFPTIISSLLMEDLIIYWSAIRRNLDFILDKVRMENSPISGQQKVVAKSRVRAFIKHHFQRHEEPSEMDKDEIGGIHELEFASNHKPSRFPKACIKGDMQLYMKTCKSNEQKLDLEVEIVQHQIIDFFNLLRKYDRFVSLFITSLFEFWTLVIVATSYIAISVKNLQVLVLLRLLQVATVLLLMWALGYMPRISRETKKAYPVICALMAYEKVHDRKKLWVRITQFYTHQPSGFTVFNNHEVTWVTIMQFILTSVSFIIIFETYRMYFVQKDD